MKRSKDERWAWGNAVHQLEIDVREIEAELGKFGFKRFQTRGELEALAEQLGPCPACGHRRTKDG